MVRISICKYWRKTRASEGLRTKKVENIGVRLKKTKISKEVIITSGKGVSEISDSKEGLGSVFLESRITKIR